MILNQNLTGNSKKEKEIQKEVILNLSTGWYLEGQNV